MTDQAVATLEDVLAVEPVIRRVVTARVRSPDDVDDLVHDCLERLLVARRRLTPEAVLPVAVVTARNVVVSRDRVAARRASSAHRLVDPRHVPSPEEEFLVREAREAMVAALDQVSVSERRAVFAYQDRRAQVSESGADESAGALRVRIARIRAKLRVEYLLAFRQVELPTPVCKPVLVAISGGDTRRQRSLRAGDHLLGCETCAALSEPLEKRSLALTAVAFPLAAVRWVAAKARAHPVTAAAGTAGAAAAAVVAASVLTSGPPTRHPVPPTSPVTTPAVLVPGLTIGRNGVRPDSSLRTEAGQTVHAERAPVQSVVSHNGFWVGASPTVRVWIELVGPLEPLRIVVGDSLRFTGTVTVNGPSYPGQVGVTGSTGAALLVAEGAHIDVATTSVAIETRR